jgi:hypothetical protein
MENLEISATTRSPEISFDIERRHLTIKGESYPEDASAFYSKILKALDEVLEKIGDSPFYFDIKLIYFNSSSAKALMTMLGRLDEAAGKGAAVTIRWFYDVEDDFMRELGEEFREDLEHADFRLEVLEAR